MNKQIHILNGDALKQQFPKQIQGEIIVARECLVDGNVKESSLEELFETRAQFISNNYNGFTKLDYYNKTVTEFKKIQHIKDNSDINLWFEEDLFCQVNFWFTVFLLNYSDNKNPVFLIKPEKHTQFGFGGLEVSELISIYENRFILSELDKLADLWKYYRNNNLEQLLKTGKYLENEYPFILKAVKAHIERFPKKGKSGRPVESLIQIIKELKSEEFEPIFKEFSKRESIYGFSDLQVKRLLSEIKKKR